MANMRSFSSDEQVKNKLYCRMNYFYTCSDELVLVKSDSVSLPKLVSVKWLTSISSLEQVIWEMYRSIHIASHNSQVGSSYLRDKCAEAFTMPVKNKLLCTRSWSTFKLWVFIRLKRIYNFWCSMLVFEPFALCFVTLRGVFMRFLELTYWQDATVPVPYFLLFLYFIKAIQEIFSELNETSSRSLIFPGQRTRTKRELEGGQGLPSHQGGAA
jgi:hypothetical protein